jgi:hypothetical protein
LIIVERLCRQGGDIRDAIVAEAMTLLSEFSLDGVTDEVFDALDLVDIQDCWDLAGRLAGGSQDGRAPPSDAAIDIIEEELQPFFDQVERYHALGMIKQEATYCMAVLLGVYRFEQESESEIKQLVEDLPAECAARLLDEWQGRNPDKTGVDAMNAFVRERCPKWTAWLEDKQ